MAHLQSDQWQPSRARGFDKPNWVTPAHFMVKRERFNGWDKYNRDYWHVAYADFSEHFVRHISSDPHSTKQIEDGIKWAAGTTGEILAKTVEARSIPPPFDVGGSYDLVIADGAWDIDHYWHEHPELRKSKLAWFMDFVGYVPMPSGGAHEAFLATDYNAEMFEHVERHPLVRYRAIFVGNPEDIAPLSFGKDLPTIRDWVPKHFDFAGYIFGDHPRTFGNRVELRQRLAYRPHERVCIVAVGGSGFGAHLIKRVLQSWPMVHSKLPELRMVVVAGPHIDPPSFKAPSDVEVPDFVPDLDRHLAACDLAVARISQPRHRR